MANVEKELVKAIRLHQWVKLIYQDSNEQSSEYWVAVTGLGANKSFFGLSYDPYRKDVVSTRFAFDWIKEAKALPFTSYQSNEELIQLVDLHPQEISWLGVEDPDEAVLDYLVDCKNRDGGNAVETAVMLADLKPVFDKQNLMKLHAEQVQFIACAIQDLYKKQEKNNVVNTDLDLIVSSLALKDGENIYPIIYNHVAFDPTNGNLIRDSEIKLNESYMNLGEADPNLKGLFTERAVDFHNDIVDSLEDKIKDITKRVKNLKNNIEIIVTKELMVLQKQYLADGSFYATIVEELKHPETLSLPLKALFHKLARDEYKPKEDVTLAIRDKDSNLDQIVGLYNSLAYPVSYVSGVPGSGKTTLVLNTVLSAYTMGYKVLISCSDDSFADSFFNRLTSTEDGLIYNGKPVDLPVLRIGGHKDIIKTTKRMFNLYVHQRYIEEDTPSEGKLAKVKEKYDKDMKNIVKAIQQASDKAAIVSMQDYYQDKATRLNLTFEQSKDAEAKVSALFNAINVIPDIDEDSLHDAITPFKDTPLTYLWYYNSLDCQRRLTSHEFAPIMKICGIDDEEERCKQFLDWIKNDDNMEMLTEAFPIIIVDDKDVASLGTGKFKFDLLIKDESPLVNIADSVLSLDKAEKAVIVANRKQYRDVCALSEADNDALLHLYEVSSAYSYLSSSLLSVMSEADTVSRKVNLYHHFRCPDEIINFASARYFDSKLLARKKYKQSGKELAFANVRTTKYIKRDTHVSTEEIDAIVNELRRRYDEDDTVFIIAPFTEQADAINMSLQQQKLYTDKVRAGTVDEFQGLEADEVYISSALTDQIGDGTYKWLKDNHSLFLQMTTKARERLVLFGDETVIGGRADRSDKEDDLYELMVYLEGKGRVLPKPLNDRRFKFDLISEENALENNLWQIFKAPEYASRYHFHRDVALCDLLSDLKEAHGSKLKLEEVVYGADNKPVFGIVLVDKERSGDVHTMEADRKKDTLISLGHLNVVKMISFYARDYDHVAQIVADQLNGGVLPASVTAEVIEEPKKKGFHLFGRH